MTEAGPVQFARAALWVTEARLSAQRGESACQSATFCQLLAIACLMTYGGWTYQDAAERLARDQSLLAALRLERAPDRAALESFLRRLDAATLHFALIETVRGLRELSLPGKDVPPHATNYSPPAVAETPDTPDTSRVGPPAPVTGAAELAEASAAPTVATPPIPAPTVAAPAGAAVEVADYPVLAPSVELVGAMKETGFTQQQWLVRRGGRFIQLTELLYRIVERADGRHTIAEIAAAVAAATNKPVSANNVQHLIQARLIPLGVMAGADGSVVQPGSSAGQRLMRSPLAVNLRLGMIGPRVLDPVTRVLQILFVSPILVTILALVVFSQWWAFARHGLMPGARQLIYTPSLMLVIIVLSVLSAIFHEFGHASGLRHGGGRARGIGAGLYLVFPALYTDVTDTYRLGRWARLRTDLGGVYFNLVFSLGVIALYFVTRQEFLLVFLLLTDLEILQQMLPFVRFDGYWILADLLGIPDFFTQMGPFLRSVLPVPWWKGPRLPHLKRWVKLAFGLYLLVTVPLLAFLMAVTVVGTPRVLPMTWASLMRQVAAWSAALRAGDVSAMSASAGQMFILLLPVLALLFMLANMGRVGLRALWTWSKRTRRRRVIAALASLALLAALAMVWLPQLALGLPYLRGTSPSTASDAIGHSGRSSVMSPAAPAADAAANAPLDAPLTRATLDASAARPCAPAVAPRISFERIAVAPSSVVPGATMTVTTTLAASCVAQGRVTLALYNASGGLVWQAWTPGQQLTGKRQIVVAQPRVPESLSGGTYTLRVGVQDPTSDNVYGWNAAAMNVNLNVAASALACAGGPGTLDIRGRPAASTAKPGTSVALLASVTASCPADAVVGFAVYDAEGHHTWDGWMSQRRLTTTAQSFHVTWNIPQSLASGTYTLVIQVYSPSRHTLYGQRTVGTITISGG